jgi:hypothetical protein
MRRPKLRLRWRGGSAVVRRFDDEDTFAVLGELLFGSVSWREAWYHW